MSELIDKKQKLLLEYIFSNRELFVICFRIMDAVYFDAPLDRVVTFTREYFNEYNGLPTFDIIDAETGILLKDRPIDRDEIPYVKNEFETFCRDKAMALAILESVDLLENHEMSAIQEAIRTAQLVKLDNDIGIDFFDDPRKRIESMDAFVDERSFGIPLLDNMIGKVRRGEMGVFYAVTSGGKSVMMANISYWLSKQKLNGVVITLEMYESLYAKRMDAIFTNSDIRYHKENVDDICDKLASIKDRHGSVTVKRMRAGTTVGDIRAYLHEYNLVNGINPDFVIVDYIGLMGVDGMSSTIGANKFDTDEQKAIGLQEIGKDLNAYMFSAGQINRDGYDIVAVNPSHCAGGLSVVNTSDWAIAMVATDEDLDNSQVQIKQLKMRNNKKSSKTSTLYMHPQSLRFTDVVSAPLPTGNRKLGRQALEEDPREDADQEKTKAKLSKAAEAREKLKKRRASK